MRSLIFRIWVMHEKLFRFSSTSPVWCRHRMRGLQYVLAVCVCCCNTTPHQQSFSVQYHHPQSLISSQLSHAPLLAQQKRQQRRWALSSHRCLRCSLHLSLCHWVPQLSVAAAAYITVQMPYECESNKVHCCEVCNYYKLIKSAFPKSILCASISFKQLQNCSRRLVLLFGISSVLFLLLFLIEIIWVSKIQYGRFASWQWRCIRNWASR